MHQDQQQHNNGDSHPPHLGVAIVTPVGTFPSEDDYRRAKPDDRIAPLLEQAAKHLKLTNTADWVVNIGDREVDSARTFREEHLTCVIELEWHKREGGGGS